MVDEKKKKPRNSSEIAEEKVEHYDESRTDLIIRLLRNLESPKEPAVTGTIVTAPIIVTLLIVGWLFQKLNQIPGNKLFNVFQTNNELFNFYLNQSLKLVILLTVSAIIVTGIGRFVRTRTGFEAERSIDKFMDHIPFLGIIYNITKVTADTVLTGPEGFRRPVKLNIGGIRTTAFKTGNVTDDGREIVFMPTSPNITTGFVLELDSSQFEEVDETAEEALTRVLSAGFGTGRSEKNSSRREDVHMIKGEVFTGMNEGADYIGMDPYQEKIESVTGFRPYPGTLNLRVNPEEAEKLREDLEPEIIESFEYRGQKYSRLEVYPVSVNGEEAAYIDIEITDYGDDVMEIVAPLNLRDRLDLEDGDEVRVDY